MPTRVRFRTDARKPISAVCWSAETPVETRVVNAWVSMSFTVPADISNRTSTTGSLLVSRLRCVRKRRGTHTSVETRYRATSDYGDVTVSANVRRTAQTTILTITSQRQANTGVSTRWIGATQSSTRIASNLASFATVTRTASAAPTESVIFIVFIGARCRLVKSSTRFLVAVQSGQLADLFTQSARKTQWTETPKPVWVTGRCLQARAAVKAR